MWGPDPWSNLRAPGRDTPAEPPPEEGHEPPPETQPNGAPPGTDIEPGATDDWAPELGAALRENVAKVVIAGTAVFVAGAIVGYFVGKGGRR